MIVRLSGNIIGVSTSSRLWYSIFTDIGSFSPIPSHACWLTMRAGRLLRVGVRGVYSGGSSGSTVIGYHLAQNTTAVTSRTLSAMLDNEYGVADFGDYPLASFAAGDLISISVDHTNVVLRSQASIELEIDA